MTISTMVAALRREPLKPQNFFMLEEKLLVNSQRGGPNVLVRRNCGELN